MKKTGTLLVVLVMIGLLGIYILWRQSSSWFQVTNTNEEITVPKTRNQPVGTTVAANTVPATTTVRPKQTATPPQSIPILDSVNLEVPFTPQAPTANWDAFHEEACEEASSIMVWHYFNHTAINSPDQVEQELADAAAWERQNLGTDVSVPASDVVKMLVDHFKLTTHILKNPTITDIKRELSAGHLIIVPAQGRFLQNPYFKQPGPRYHMLVIRGYDGSGQFMTNDPGTKRGEKYPYDPEVLLNAVHDWNGGDVENGAKVAIVVSGLI